MTGLLLNSTKLGVKEYTINDSKGFLLNETIPTGFYGGRVERFAKTDIEGLLMCIEKMQVIDLYIPDMEKVDLESFDLKTLKIIAAKKGIEFAANATREKMLELLN